jgi:hypothetical protein
LAGLVVLALPQSVSGAEGIAPVHVRRRQRFEAISAIMHTRPAGISKSVKASTRHFPERSGAQACIKPATPIVARGPAVHLHPPRASGYVWSAAYFGSGVRS